MLYFYINKILASILAPIYSNALPYYDDKVYFHPLQFCQSIISVFLKYIVLFYLFNYQNCYNKFLNFH